MGRLFWLTCAGWLSVAGLAFAQTSDVPPNPSSSSVSPATPDRSTTSGRDDESATATSNANTPNESSPSAVSANPAADNILIGTGALGRVLGFDKESGVRLGGAWIGDANWLMSGGLRPGQWSLNGLTLLDLSLDADKLFDIKGGLFGIQFLQFSGQPTNEQAGSVQGYNGLEATPPLVRQELYELWWRQVLLDDKLVLRVGKTVPTYDFNNVGRPAPSDDVSANIPSVTGLIYTPVFKNPTLIGKMPGYYNSATGITASFIPNKNV